MEWILTWLWQGIVIAVITVAAFPVTDGPNGVKIRLTELRDLAAATLQES